MIQKEVGSISHVSGKMVKPSMYNCLTLIKGRDRGGGVCAEAKGPAPELSQQEGCFKMETCLKTDLVLPRPSTGGAAAESIWQMWHTCAHSQTSPVTHGYPLLLLHFNNTNQTFRLWHSRFYRRYLEFCYYCKWLINVLLYQESS